MCYNVALLELSGQGYTASLLKEMYDLDEVWIEMYKMEIQSATHGA